MAGTFVETSDVTDISGTDKINNAGITDGQNATDSGNLKLTVEDHSGTYGKESDALNLAKGENAYATTIATLDMTLDSMVSKGNGQYWTDNIISFENDIKVNLKLNDATYVPGDAYVVVREHDGQLEKLTTNYGNGMLEVPTNKFSTYSIVKIPVAETDRPNIFLGYDPRGEGEEAGTVTVKCGETELVGTDGYYKYDDPEQTIKFELKRPADRADTENQTYTPIVEVVFPQENDADTVVIYPKVANNTFSVTPSTDSGITSGSPFMEVYVHWSAYDMVGPEEDQFMVILRKYSDNDSFVFQNNPTIEATESLDGETKYIFADGTNVSVEIQPGENRELVEVYVDTNGQLTHYSAEPQEGDRNIAELKTSDGKFVVPDLAPWTFVEAICNDLPVLSDIRLTDTNQTLYDTMKRSEVGVSATCKIGDRKVEGTVKLEGGDYLLVAGENEYGVIFTSNVDENGDRFTLDGTITLKVLHKIDISNLGWNGTTFTYNGASQGPTFSSDLPEGIRVVSKRDDSEVNKGEYTGIANIALAEGFSSEYFKLANSSGTTGIVITENGAIATVTHAWSITAKDLASAEITLGDALTYKGEAQTQTIVSVKVDGITLTQGTDYTVSGNTGTDANTYTLTITGQGNYTGTATKDWVIEKKSISSATITLGDALTYNGTTQTQSVASVKVGEATLTSEDYTVSDNQQKNAGTYTLTLTGNGNYTGTATKDWVIEKKSISSATITLGDALTYNGTTQTQSVASVKVGEASLTSVDYTVSDNQQKDVGTYTLTVTGKGNYVGTATQQFTIGKATVTPSLTGTATKVYDGNTTLPESNSLSLTVTGTAASDTLTVSAADYVYDDASVGSRKTITASGIAISGEKAKNYTLSGTTATVSGGEITQATPTITLSGLSETTQAPEGVKATLNPADASAQVVIEYQVVDTTAVEATYKWITTRPTTPGTYKVRAYLPTETSNVAAIAAENAVTGTYTLTQYTAPSGGGSSSGSNSGSNSGSSGSSSSGGATSPAPTTPENTEVTTPEATENTTTTTIIRIPTTTTEESITETTPETTIGVSSEDGSEGWSDIKAEISDKLSSASEAAEGEEVVVTVEMNGESTVPADVFETIKGQNVAVTFDMGNGIVWTVNGMDVTGDSFEDINFDASTGEGVTAIPAELVTSLAADRFSMELTLEYEGEFGFTAVMSVDVDKENAGKYANLFYFNPITKIMEYVCSAPIKEDGTADLTFTHASDYVIVVDEKMMSVADNTSIDEVQETAEQETSVEMPPEDVDMTENNSFNPLWIIVIVIVVLLIGGTAILAVKKKSE